MYDNLPDPINSAEEAIAKLEEAIGLLNEVVSELKNIDASKVEYEQISTEELKVAEGNEVYKHE